MRSTWVWLALLVGCHRDRAPTRPPSALANVPAVDARAQGTSRSSEFEERFASLPRAIVMVAPRALGDLTAELVRSVDPVFEAACWSRLAAKVDGYYDVKLADSPELGVFQPAILHGRLALDELRSCRAADEVRRRSSHPKVLIAAEAGFFPVVFADLGHDWTLVISGELPLILPAAEALAAAPATEANPLAGLVGPSAAPGWRAIALDVTSELFGVPSIGVGAEFTPSPGDEPPQGPVTLTVRFESGDAARRALAAMSAPRTDLFDEPVAESLRLARQLGTVAVVEDAVVYRGSVTPAFVELQNLYLAYARGPAAPP